MWSTSPARRMPRDPAADAPLSAQPFPPPPGAVAAALDVKAARKRHPGLEEETAVAAAAKPLPPVPPNAMPVNMNDSAPRNTPSTAA